MTFDLDTLPPAKRQRAEFLIDRIRTRDHSYEEWLRRDYVQLLHNQIEDYHELIGITGDSKLLKRIEFFDRALFKCFEGDD
jgi:hypothetical protein